MNENITTLGDVKYEISMKQYEISVALWRRRLIQENTKLRIQRFPSRAHTHS